jgi:single-stranded-DNA-specific exonuclease
MPLNAQWTLFPEQLTTVKRLSQCLDLDPIIAQILLNRNLTSLNQVETFLGSSKQSNTVQLPEDSLRASWEFVAATIKANQRILIYGDYDVDGMTSTAMMVASLRVLGADVSYYIPDRFNEGYGLNLNVVSFIQEHNINLLITLDCGVTSTREISEIKSKTSAKVIVMDHHTLPDQLPPFDTMVNPKMLADTHYLSGLCTAGIVYYWCVYGQRHGYITISSMSWFLCLAAIGTVADVAPLIGGNRDLVRDGLNAIKSGHHLGVQTLLELANINQSQITAKDIGFVIAPRLNASGRLSNAKIGVQLLLSATKQQAHQIAIQLETLNNERRAIDHTMREEAVSIARNINDSILVIYKPHWHPGVIGITAAKLVDQFSKPTVLMTLENGVIRGSARSAGRTNIYALLKACENYFISFGGHQQAAGFSLNENAFNAFFDTLVTSANASISPQSLRPIITIDTKLSPDQITNDLATKIDILRPFGHHNAPPTFYTDNLNAIDFKLVGQGRHLKVTFQSPSSQHLFHAIGFGMNADFLPLLQQNTRLSIAYHLTLNYWNNQTKLQLQLLDIKKM